MASRVKVQGRAKTIIDELANERGIFVWYGKDFHIQGGLMNIGLFMQDLKIRFGTETYQKITHSTNYSGADGVLHVRFNGVELVPETMRL